METRVDTNDNDITTIYNNDIGNYKIMNSNHNKFKDFIPRNREELLALDLAEALNDYEGIALYISYSRKYQESLLRRVLSEVMKIPDEKIKKSRGALFNHLVKKYGQKNYNSRWN